MFEWGPRDTALAGCRVGSVLMRLLHNISQLYPSGEHRRRRIVQWQATAAALLIDISAICESFDV